MRKDLLYGFRLLAKSPGLTVTAVLALALGIGANTAIFSVVNTVMIAKLPFEQPDRLAMVWEKAPATGKTNVVNPINFLEWQLRNHSFERIAALLEWPQSLAGDGEPEQVDALIVSADFLPIMGVRPLLGRWFTPKEDTPGNDNVAILSEGLWRRRYGADRNVFGRQIRLNNQSMTVVGVMPGGFRFPFTKADLFIPLAIDRARSKDVGRYLETVARLKKGATLASAQADMEILARQLQKERPDFDAKWGATVVGLREQVAGDVRTPLLVLLGAVGLVLLIACANVANLLLMRAAGRDREIAIRVALGADAWRIARLLLTESLLLALLGGTLGLLTGLWTADALSALLPGTATYSNLKTIRIDATVFLFTLGLSVLTGMLFGLAPAWKAARGGIHAPLKEGARGIAGGRSRLRGALVVGEVALAMVLATGAGLLIRSFARLAGVAPGFDAAHVLSMQVNTSGRFNSDEKFLDFTTQMLERVRAVPGVEAAGTSHFLPLGRGIPGTGFHRADRPAPAPGDEPVTEVLVVMPGYFAALKIPLVRGRVFAEQDRKGTPPVLVVNQTLAREFYPNENPVGKRLFVEWGHPNESYEIVGVVGDVHQTSLGEQPKPGVFLADLQEPTGPVNLVVRAAGDPKLLARAIESQVHSLDKEVPISEVRTMDEYVSDSVAEPRFQTIVLGVFAALALLLAGVGIYGVISYSIAQRTRELGVRRAMGADTANLVWLVIRQGMTLALAGVAAGALSGLALTRLLTSLLYGVTPGDPLTFVAGGAVLILAALAACYVPARRAARVDPMVALRYE
ncbi:MAG: ABC transporter permease [Bryobacteraceae bacterium]